MLVVIVATLLSVFGVFVASAFAAWDDVKTNWPEHRCNPFYMPFAEAVRPDVSASENFIYCTNQMSASIWGQIGGQMSGYFGTMGDTLNSLAEPLSGFRNVITGMRRFMFSFMSQTISKAANSTSMFIFYLDKIRDVMKRFVAQGYLGAYLSQVMVDFVWAFVTLFITILKIFVAILLAIAFILALFNPVLLVLAIVLASLIAASGF
jgi:hypothetical protein